jgi:rhodanese-related sulfurtransferase
MARPIALPTLRTLLDEGAQLVEVLPAEEYNELHLPGAVHIPLKTLDAATTSGLDRQRPVIVYCWDALCDMSPRAACRLEALSFTQVHDYVPGKVDWLAHNLPVEGSAANIPTIGRHLRHDVVTAALDEPITDVRPRVTASDFNFALVLAEDTTLLGRLRPSALATADPHSRAEEIMELGPSTLRPHELAAKIRERLQQRQLSYAIVTDPEGHLLGTVHPTDLL